MLAIKAVVQDVHIIVRCRVGIRMDGTMAVIDTITQRQTVSGQDRQAIQIADPPRQRDVQRGIRVGCRKYHFLLTDTDRSRVSDTVREADVVVTSRKTFFLSAGRQQTGLCAGVRETVR